MRILSLEHAMEVQLLDLSRITRFRELCFGAGVGADDLACELLDAEIRHPDYARVPASVRSLVDARMAIPLNEMEAA